MKWCNSPLKLPLSFDDCPGGAVSVVKTVDEPLIASNTLQNDDELFFDVEANEVWTVEFNLQSTSNTTADYRFAVTAPGGSTCYVSAENVENAQSKNQSGYQLKPHQQAEHKYQLVF